VSTVSKIRHMGHYSGFEPCDFNYIVSLSVISLSVKVSCNIFSLTVPTPISMLYSSPSPFVSMYINSFLLEL
jgi:hypothetical protein